MGQARIILLLISSDYIGADEYYEDELLRAVERHDRGEARVIPILLRPFRVSGEPFAKLRRSRAARAPSSVIPAVATRPSKASPRR